MLRQLSVLSPDVAPATTVHESWLANRLPFLKGEERRPTAASSPHPSAVPRLQTSITCFSHQSFVNRRLTSLALASA
jgi:hypothetical protein